MKKLCILILAVVLFSSCGIKKSGREKERIELQTEIYDRLNVFKFNYSDHSYILFDIYTRYGCKDGIVHDPDCRCYGKEDKQ